MPQSDAELIRAVLGGSQRACADIVKRYQRPLFNLILRMVRDRQLAEDLSQEVFVKAFRALHTFDPHRKFSSWLFKIGHNATIDHLRRRQVATVPLETDDSDSMSWSDALADPQSEDPGIEQQRGELMGLIEGAIQELPPAFREAMLLRYLEDLSYQEISEITGTSIGAVKTNLHRGRKALAVLLEARGITPEGYDEE